MRYILFGLFIFSSTFLLAQNMYLAKPITNFIEVYDERGNPLTANVPSVKGSPLWKDEWSNASVEMFNGKTYKNMKLIVNLVNGHIHFLENKSEFQFLEPIKKVTLYHSEEGVFDSTQFIKLSVGDPLLYAVKARGPKYYLISLMQKKAVEYYDYGKSSGGKTFEIFNEYFLFNTISNTAIPIKGKSVQQLFTDDADKVLQLFPQSKKRKSLSTQDITAMIAAL